MGNHEVESPRDSLENQLYLHKNACWLTQYSHKRMYFNAILNCML